MPLSAAALNGRIWGAARGSKNQIREACAAILTAGNRSNIVSS